MLGKLTNFKPAEVSRQSYERLVFKKSIISPGGFHRLSETLVGRQEYFTARRIGIGQRGVGKSDSMRGSEPAQPDPTSPPALRRLAAE